MFFEEAAKMDLSYQAGKRQGSVLILTVGAYPWRPTVFPSCRVPFSPDHCTVAVFSYK